MRCVCDSGVIALGRQPYVSGTWCDDIRVKSRYVERSEILISVLTNLIPT